MLILEHLYVIYGLCFLTSGVLFALGLYTVRDNFGGSVVKMTMSVSAFAAGMYLADVAENNHIPTTNPDELLKQVQAVNNG